MATNIIINGSQLETIAENRTSSAYMDSTASGNSFRLISTDGYNHYGYITGETSRYFIKRPATSDATFNAIWGKPLDISSLRYGENGTYIPFVQPGTAPFPIVSDWSGNWGPRLHEYASSYNYHWYRYANGYLQYANTNSSSSSNLPWGNLIEGKRVIMVALQAGGGAGSQSNNNVLGSIWGGNGGNGGGFISFLYDLTDGRWIYIIPGQGAVNSSTSTGAAGATGGDSYCYTEHGSYAAYATGGNGGGGTGSSGTGPGATKSNVSNLTNSTYSSKSCLLDNFPGKQGGAGGWYPAAGARSYASAGTGFTSEQFNYKIIPTFDVKNVCRGNGGPVYYNGSSSDYCGGGGGGASALGSIVRNADTNWVWTWYGYGAGGYGGDDSGKIATSRGLACNGRDGVVIVHY